MTELIEYTRGLDPDKDAWVTNFFTENHLAYEAFPDMVASPEQLNFMVYLQPDQIYYPCFGRPFSCRHRKTGRGTAYLSLYPHLEQVGTPGARSPSRIHTKGST